MAACLDPRLGPVEVATMDITIKILRRLWRRRLLVAGVAVLAVLAGTAVMYQLPSLQPRSYEVGVATGQILLDTPDSEVVALDPKGADGLGVRANVIASLMVSGDIEAVIAKQAGLRPSQLGGSTDAATLGSLASGGSALPSTAPSGRDAYILTTQTLTDTLNDPLPIIEFTAQGPTPAAAARLANATVTGVRDYLGTTAAAEEIPDSGRVQVTGLGTPQVKSQAHGPTAVVMLVVVILMFGLGCGAIVGFPILARSWRAAAALEDRGDDTSTTLDSEPVPSTLRDYVEELGASVALRRDTPPRPVAAPGSGASALHEEQIIPPPRYVAANDTSHARLADGSGGWRLETSGGDEATADRSLPTEGQATPADHRPQTGRHQFLTAELAAARAERDRSQRERPERQARRVS